ncbi:MAG TPA: carboxymuconolactone decarboxylase family protein [Acidocella sp.]|nr:carboxymuconolactone decarboxylase family protein [Acidocella sp.]
MSTDRLPPIADADLTPEQVAARQALLAGARGVFQGPFIPLLRNPALLSRVEKLGAYLRYESRLPGRIREFAILVVARAYSQQVEWAIHQPLALQEGVRALVVAAIAEGRRPELMPEDEAVTWDFLAELEAHRSVSDATYARAVRQFGEAGMLDLVAIAGYYGLLGLVMNTARTAAPEGPRLPTLR